MRCALLVVLVAMMATGSVCAGEADVVDASARLTGDNTYSFSVTVAHGDTGWEHYADRWQVLAPDGTVLGERVLLHPHETEQPFTRSLSGVVIPAGVDEVVIRAGDSVHEFGGKEFRLRLSDAGS